MKTEKVIENVIDYAHLIWALKDNVAIPIDWLLTPTPAPFWCAFLYFRDWTAKGYFSQISMQLGSIRRPIFLHGNSLS